MIVYKHARIQDNVFNSKLSISFHFELFPWNPIFGMFAKKSIMILSIYCCRINIIFHEVLQVTFVPLYVL